MGGNLSMDEPFESRTTHRFRRRIILIFGGCIIASLAAVVLIALMADLPARRADAAARRFRAAQAAAVAVHLLEDANLIASPAAQVRLRTLRDAVPGATRICVLERQAGKGWVYRLDLPRDPQAAVRPGAVCSDAAELGDSLIRQPVARDFGAPGLSWGLAPIPGTAHPMLAAVAIDPAQSADTVHLLGWGLVLGPLVALLFAPLVAYLVCGRVTRHLDELIAAAQRVRLGDFDTAVGHGNEDELDHLSQAFNAMLTSLRTDPLTGLGNTRYLEERLSQEIARSLDQDQPLALLMVDIDQLDRINRVHGWPVGDRVLRDLGRLLEENLCKFDLATRYSEDDFAVVLPNTTIEGALSTAHRLRQRIEREFGVGLTPQQHKDEFEPPDGPTELMVTVSIGVAGCPSDARSARSLLAAAALAEGRAKQLAGAMVVAYNSFSSRLGRADPARALRDARISGLQLLIEATKE